MKLIREVRYFSAVSCDLMGVMGRVEYNKYNKYHKGETDMKLYEMKMKMDKTE